MAKVLITTVPFGQVSSVPIEILKRNGLEVVINPLGRRPTSDELIELLDGVDYLIAGLEHITPEVLNKATHLKLISRVGVGIDNVPINEANKRGIKVTYTPDAPTQAVAELTIGLILDCARRFSQVDREIRNGKWIKHMGNLLQGKTIGIIGLGRIGKALVTLLKPFGVTILANDLIIDGSFIEKNNIRLVSKEDLYKESDFVCIHLSYSPEVKHLVNKEVFSLMKNTAYIVNTSRGPVINEEDLLEALKENHIAGAALDVYEQEPYLGKLIELPNIILTAHIGAATVESRYLMELGASEEVVRFYTGKPLQNEVNTQ